MINQLRAACPSLESPLGGESQGDSRHKVGKKVFHKIKILSMFLLTTCRIENSVAYVKLLIVLLIPLTGCATEHPLPALSEFDLTRARSTLQNAPQPSYYHRRLPEQWAMMKRVGERLARASQPICTDIAKRPCTLQLVLVEASEVNAFAKKPFKTVASDEAYICTNFVNSRVETEPYLKCMIKTYFANPIKQSSEIVGAVAITTGLLNLLASDDELSALLGHEFAHHICGHISRAETRALVWTLVGDAVYLTLKFAPQFIAASKGNHQSSSASDASGSDFAKNWLETSRILAVQNYGRSEEMEADYIGGFLVARARYNLDSAVRAFARFLRCSPQNPQCNQKSSTILDTHPSAPERIATWQKAAARLRLSPDTLPSTLAW